VQVTAYGQQTVLDWGVVRSCDPLKNFGAPATSLEWLNLKSVKFCTPVVYINSSNRMTYHPQKGCGSCDCFKILSWCSASRGFVSDSWATCVFILLVNRLHIYAVTDVRRQHTWVKDHVNTVNASSPLDVQSVMLSWGPKSFRGWRNWNVQGLLNHCRCRTYHWYSAAVLPFLPCSAMIARYKHYLCPLMLFC